MSLSEQLAAGAEARRRCHLLGPQTPTSIWRRAADAAAVQPLNIRHGLYGRCEQDGGAPEGLFIICPHFHHVYLYEQLNRAKIIQLGPLGTTRLLSLNWFWFILSLNEIEQDEQLSHRQLVYYNISRLR